MKTKSIIVKIILLSITLFSENISGQNGININSDCKTSIDSYIENKMNESGIVGIGAAVIINKKVEWTKGYGYSDKQNKKPFTPSTIMNIASINKTGHYKYNNLLTAIK